MNLYSKINLERAKKGSSLACVNNQAFKSNWTIFMKIFALSSVCIIHFYDIYSFSPTIFITSVNPHNNKATFSAVCRFADFNSGLSYRPLGSDSSHIRKIFLVPTSAESREKTIASHSQFTYSVCWNGRRKCCLLYPTKHKMWK